MDKLGKTDKPLKTTGENQPGSLVRRRGKTRKILTIFVDCRATLYYNRITRSRLCLFFYSGHLFLFLYHIMISRHRQDGRDWEVL